MMILALALTLQQDSAVLTAVRLAAQRDSIEVFGDVRGSTRIRGVQLLDIEGDGWPEGFVWVDPSFRQTPTILVYTYDPQQGAHRILEALVPGRLYPVSGRFRDSHNLGYGLDWGVAGGKEPVDPDRLIQTAAGLGFSVVRYRTFMHSDSREGFVSFVDLNDRTLPSPETEDCGGFEFSLVQALTAGSLEGDPSGRYLVALTAGDITIYRFRRVRPNGMLDKDTWIRDRPPSATGLHVAAHGQVEILTQDGHSVPVPAP
jgi:hypothetical protein